MRNAMRTAWVLLICIWSCVTANDVIFLDAFSPSGKDGRWTDRGGGWMGITGDHVWHSNVPMWWDDFPGPSGNYTVRIVAGTECDGAPTYAIQINSTTVFSGAYPDGGGNCDDCGVVEQVLLCTNQAYVPKGATVRLLGSSVYPCGDHGAYTRFKGLNLVCANEPCTDPMSTKPRPAGFSLSKEDDPLQEVRIYAANGTVIGTYSLSDLPREMRTRPVGVYYLSTPANARPVPYGVWR